MKRKSFIAMLGIVSVLLACASRESRAAAKPAPAPNMGMAGDLDAMFKPKGKAPAPTQRRGTIYRHVIGFSFWHPTGWQVKEQEDFLQLVPPRPAATAAGPSELYFIVGDSVAGQGILHPGDYRVVQYLDQTIRSLSPTMTRVGKPHPVPTSKGQGVLLQWQGRSATGKVVHARAYASIIKDHGVALVALGLPDALKPREDDLRQMFASFGFGQGPRDPLLVGKWHLFATRSITNWSIYETDWSRAQLVSDTNSVLVFRPDGTWTRSDKYHMLAGAGGTWIENKEHKVTSGRWNAAAGALYMVWKDNSWDDYKYQLARTQQGIQFRLISANTAQIWKRVE